MTNKSGTNQIGRSAKPGRPSNLALYRPYWCMEEVITAMVGVRLDCAEWFQLYGGYVFRTFSTGATTERFDVPKEMRSHIKQRLEQITTSLEQRKDSSKPKPPDAQLGRWFEQPDNPNLKLLVPPLHLSDDQ